MTTETSPTVAVAAVYTTDYRRNRKHVRMPIDAVIGMMGGIQNSCFVFTLRRKPCPINASSAAAASVDDSL